jgi:hypothetical protein
MASKMEDGVFLDVGGRGEGCIMMTLAFLDEEVKGVTGMEQAVVDR